MNDRGLRGSSGASAMAPGGALRRMNPARGRRRDGASAASRAGVRRRAFAVLREAGQPDLGEVFRDGMSVRPPQGGRRKRGALGGSRGGYGPKAGGTKAGALCEARGRRLGFTLIPGQAAELRAGPGLLRPAAWRGPIRRVVCEAACSSAAGFARVREARALPVVRASPTRRQHGHFDRAACRRGHKMRP